MGERPSQPRRMQNFFLACALLGGAIVVLQLVFGMAGAHDVPHETVEALMAIAVLLNGVGLLAWRRGLLGHWYPIAIGLSTLALLADPMSLPGVASAGAIAAMLLGGFGLVVSVRHRMGGTVGAASR